MTRAMPYDPCHARWPVSRLQLSWHYRLLRQLWYELRHCFSKEPLQVIQVDV